MQGTQKGQNNLENTTAEKLKPQPKCPSTDEWINKTQNNYRKKYYSAIKRNKILIYIYTRRMNLDNIMLSERSYTPYDSIYTKCPQQANLLFCRR